MKFLKLLAVACLLATATLVVPAANATTIPTVVFAGAGSTAVFNALYDAALSSSACGTNLYSHGAGTYPPPFTNGGTVHDNRSTVSVPIPDDNQKYWVSFDGTLAANFTDTTVICIYVGVDSSVGVRGFLAAPRASIIISDSPGTASSNQVNGYNATVAALPQAIWNDVNTPGSSCVGTTLTTCTTVTGTTMNIAFSDVRPEDATYATCRALSARAAGSTLPTGAGYFSSSTLGYGNWNNCSDPGATPAFTAAFSIASSFSATVATATYFEQVPGNKDLISGATTGTYATWPVGAIPVIIAVSNNDTTANTGFGNGVPGNYLLKNVDRFNMSYAVDGLYSRTRDLIGVTGAASVPFEVITREPLSGTYNAFEFTVPRTHDVQGSQEDGIYPCIVGSCVYNPLNVLAPDGSGGLRFRAIGTGEMVKAIAGSVTPKATLNAGLPDRLGYFFWGYGNILPLTGSGCTSSVAAGPPFPLSATVSGCTSSSTYPIAHYLTLDGVDPLYNTPLDNPQGPYNPPTCGSTGPGGSVAPPCPTIPFTHLNDGSYGAWTIVRMVVDPTVTTIPSATGIGEIYSTLLTTSATKFSDFDPASNLHVFRSHRSFLYEGAGSASLQAVEGTLCTLPAAPVFGANLTGQDMGNDAGGALLTITGDQDYAIDYQGATAPSAAQCGEAGGSNYGIVGQQQ